MRNPPSALRTKLDTSIIVGLQKKGLQNVKWKLHNNVLKKQKKTREMFFQSVNYKQYLHLQAVSKGKKWKKLKQKT